MAIRERAVSNVVGILLITAIVVLLVGMITTTALGSVSELAQNKPLVDFKYEVTNESVMITHGGGDSVDLDEVTVIFDGTDGNVSRFRLEDATNISGDGDGSFETGEKRSQAHSVRETAWIKITIIHEPTNRIISDAPNEFRVSSVTGGAPPNPTPTATPSTPTPTPELDDPPNASIDNVTDNSQSGGAGGNKAEFEVGWSATDDNDIIDVTIELIRTSDNTVVDTANPPASGQSASGTDTLSQNGGWMTDYEIKITVEDSAGQIATDSVNETADGVTDT